MIYHPGAQESGSAQATVFGKEWNASASITRYPDSTSQYFQVYFETYSDDGSTRDQISLGVFDGKKRIYEIEKNPFDYNFEDSNIQAVYSFWISDGDLLYGNYIIDSEFANVVTVDKNDGSTIEGSFSLVFKVRVDGSHSDIPSKLHFKDGKFSVKLKH
jgi:hypothetical protein